MDDRADVSRLKAVGYDGVSENDQIKLLHHNVAVSS
jgi:hypothetical protein